MSEPQMTDTKLEEIVSVILRTGVLVSGTVVLAGGIYFVFRHGAESVNYQKFVGQPAIDTHVGQIIKGVFNLRARSIIQFGILLLVATPIARVISSLIGFVMERDFKYVAITAVVLAVLLFSLIHGAVQG